MKALVYSAVREVTVQDVPEPQPRPDQAVVRVRCAGICGSDMAGFLGHSARRRPPLVLGHEVIGTVVQAPAPASRPWSFAVGDRVVANPIQSCGECDNCRSGRANICPDWKLIGMDREPGAFAEYVAVKASNLFPVAAGVADEQAVMVEPLANGVHLFNLIRRHQLGTIALFGAGTQGILLLSLARMFGYRRIAVVDTNRERLEVARQLGAELLLDPRGADAPGAIRDWADGLGADIGIDAAGVTAVREGLIESVRKGGEVMLLGLHTDRSEIDFSLVVRKELGLQGSYAYTPADFATAKRLIENGDVSLLPWTETRPLEAGQDSFDLLTTDPGAVLKIVLRP